MAEQIPFDDVGLAPNPEPRCPCVLLLDVSGSMAGSRISQLNEALLFYKKEVCTDSLAAQRVEPAVVTFGTAVETMCPFTIAEYFQPPTLSSGGSTAMGAGILRAIEMIAERKTFYREQGLHYFRPWIFLITDGEPTDEWQTAAVQVKQGEQSKQFVFFCVGVEDANMAVLQTISVRQPLKLRGLAFRELFMWLSQSQKSVSRSTPGLEDRITLANPTAPNGWATI